MLEVYHKLHPKSKSISERKEALQVIWDSLHDTGTDQRGGEKLHTMTEDMHKNRRLTIRARKLTVKHQT